MRKENSQKKIFLLYLIISVSLVIVFTLGIDILKRQRIINEFTLKSTAQLNYQGSLLLSQFDSVRSDLLFLPQLNEFFSYLEDVDEKDRLLIEHEFLEFTKSKLVYDQIRYIDSTGQEIVRINFNKGFSCIVSHSDLQNKGDRYYFKEAMGVPKGEVYISPFDLNIENGQIEQPLKPMLRFGTPIFNHRNELKGIVILNYLGNTILQELQRASSDYPGTFSLLNSDGYWLYNDSVEDEWGFMYPEREDLTFSNRYPDSWKTILDNTNATILSKNSLMTSLRVTPFRESSRLSEQRSWILVNTVSFKEMNILWKQILRHNILPGIILIMISAVVSYVLSRAVFQRNKYQKALKRSALYDALTDLPNRILLEDRVHQAREQSLRYSHYYGLLFVDLDGFKSVNDNYGHKVGDELLIEVSRRLKMLLRSIDTIARFGGDEFVILLDQIQDPVNLKSISQKILKVISEEYDLSEGRVTLGASIGYVVGDPSSPQSFESLLQRADKAMYKVKTKGKGDIAEG